MKPKLLAGFIIVLHDGSQPQLFVVRFCSHMCCRTRYLSLRVFALWQRFATLNSEGERSNFSCANFWIFLRSHGVLDKACVDSALEDPPPCFFFKIPWFHVKHNILQILRMTKALTYCPRLLHPGSRCRSRLTAPHFTKTVAAGLCRTSGVLEWPNAVQDATTDSTAASSPRMEEEEATDRRM